MDKHTPLPWYLLSGGVIANTVGPDYLAPEHFVACVQERYDPAKLDANLRLIVRAVNAHDELVAALRQAQAALTGGGASYVRRWKLDQTAAARAAVSAALAKVDEK